jgi:hypothetical protein
MYTYDAVSDELRCVSCMPDGTPPTSNVEASQNGLFMADDGRTAFSTADPLVPQDTNEKYDVYEFVENKAQLITSGTAANDRAGAVRTGLTGLSADGTDLYFITMETFVGQDLNGPFFKFYDARTGGGFPFSPPPAPCNAADECHGLGSTAPDAITPGTGTSLGVGGNAANVKQKRHRRKKTKRGRGHNSVRGGRNSNQKDHGRKVAGK